MLGILFKRCLCWISISGGQATRSPQALRGAHGGLGPRGKVPAPPRLGGAGAGGVLGVGPSGREAWEVGERAHSFVVFYAKAVKARGAKAKRPCLFFFHRHQWLFIHWTNMFSHFGGNFRPHAAGPAVAGSVVSAGDLQLAPGALLYRGGPWWGEGGGGQSIGRSQ